MTSDRDSWDDPEREGPSQLDQSRRSTYRRRFVPAITVYAALIASLSVSVNDDAQRRWAWFLIPAIPLLWIAYALLQDARSADEFQRALITQTMSIGFGTAMIAAVVVGLLGAGGVSGPWGGWVVFTAGMLGWSVSGAFFERRASRWDEATLA